MWVWSVGRELSNSVCQARLLKYIHPVWISAVVMITGSTEVIFLFEEE